MALRRRNRVGELTCRCDAYGFPHRFGGGKCDGAFLPAEYWEEAWGAGTCRECLFHDKTYETPYCQVVNGQENVTHCEVWRQFVQVHDITLYGKIKGWAYGEQRPQATLISK